MDRSSDLWPVGTQRAQPANGHEEGSFKVIAIATRQSWRQIAILLPRRRNRRLLPHPNQSTNQAL